MKAVRSGSIPVEVLLLGDSSVALRLRALRELLDTPETDPEVAHLMGRLEADALVQGALTGSQSQWVVVCFQLCRLAYLGVRREHPVVERLAECIFASQAEDGAFPLAAFTGEASRYSAVPLQTAIPLRALASAGYAGDARAERAYEWLLAQRLDDGAWPSGYSAGQPGFVAGYRRLPGSRGCRANTTSALACLSLHPERAASSEARAALDLLLQRETREESAIGVEVSRLVGAEEPSGFFTFYARFDLAFILDIASRMGASTGDPRIDDLVDFLGSLRTGSGLWEHPAHPELSRWLTLDVLLSLKRLRGGDWEGALFRTPFRAYAPRSRRY